MCDEFSVPKSDESKCINRHCRSNSQRQVTEKYSAANYETRKQEPYRPVPKNMRHNCSSYYARLTAVELATAEFNGNLCGICHKRNQTSANVGHGYKYYHGAAGKASSNLATNLSRDAVKPRTSLHGSTTNTNNVRCGVCKTV